MGINDKGLLGILKRDLRVVESVVSLNQHIYVLGDVVDDPEYRKYQKGPMMSPYTIRKSKIMIISFKSEVDLTRSKILI